jgi:hypothetical protein
MDEASFRQIVSEIEPESATGAPAANPAAGGAATASGPRGAQKNGS